MSVKNIFLIILRKIVMCYRANVYVNRHDYILLIIMTLKDFDNAQTIYNLGGNHKGCPYRRFVGATLVVALVGVIIYLKGALKIVPCFNAV
jgi:hypothetical protein